MMKRFLATLITNTLFVFDYSVMATDTDNIVVLTDITGGI